MSMDSAHSKPASATPAPWRRGSDELTSPELFSEIYAPNGYLIAVCQTAHTRGKDQRESVEVARANAEHIVLCVNAHYTLIDALEWARCYVKAASTRLYDGTNGQGMREEATRRLALIDAAIAKATGAKP